MQPHAHNLTANKQNRFCVDCTSRSVAEAALRKRTKETEKRTSLITSACKCSEPSAWESTWLSTNVNDPALDWMKQQHRQVWRQELTRGGTICVPDTDLLGMNAEMQRHLKKIYSLAKMMPVFLICFFASRLEHLLKLIFLRTEAWAGWDQDYSRRESAATW